MALHLDGKLWGPWIAENYPKEIKSLRDALLTKMLPSLPDAEEEATAHQQAMWEWAMSRPSDGNDDGSWWAEWAQEQGFELYERLTRVRQAVLNMGTVMLWHLLEQQMLCFHRRRVLSIHEENDALNDPKVHKKLYRIEEFEERLAAGGLCLDQVAAWSKVKELRLVANAVKHGPGVSALKLHAIRPELFTAPGLSEDTFFNAPNALRIGRPAGGEDIYVTDKDLEEYFDATLEFWNEFAARNQQ
ncbi:MAG: hypothetical protein HZB26_10920 [Candidatus Hydrogenedentes bacterium]|nr:hypothetical protein [Candidatus Hydrogenedentota bacterium]